MVQVDPDDVAIGSTIVVKPGERIPLDGVVLEGELHTGHRRPHRRDPAPRTVRPGDEVISGCVNGRQRAASTDDQRIYDESTVAKILELVENSSQQKGTRRRTSSPGLPDTTPPAVMHRRSGPGHRASPCSWAAGWSDWITRALTFLVISCPCALVISVPLSFFGGIGGASKCGILVKGGNYLEALAKTGRCRV